MRSLLLTLALVLSIVPSLFSQCCQYNNGHICMATSISSTNQGNLYAGSGWKSVTINSNSKHQFKVYDTLYATNDNRTIYFEFYTCSSQDLQLIMQPANGYFSTANRRNSNNHNCGSNANDEQASYPCPANTYLYLYVLGDSCNNTSGSFTLYYRTRCKTNSLETVFPENNWRGYVYNYRVDPNYGNQYMGSYADEQKNFTYNFGSSQPPVISNCAMCPDSSYIDNDSFNIYYRMRYGIQDGYYRIICNTPSDLTLSAHNGTNTYNLMTFLNTNGQFPVKSGTFFIDSIDPLAGKWIYYTQKDTGSLKADISICRMNGDFKNMFGINEWKAYVFDSAGVNPPGAPYFWRNSYYQGTFVAPKLLAYDWTTDQPPMTGERCGCTMNNIYYNVLFNMKTNFTPGRYKFRLRLPGGGNLNLLNKSGNSTQTILNTYIGGAYDVTSSFYTLNTDTLLQLRAFKYTDPGKLSYNHCREPKNPGGIRVNSNALTTGNDTVCIGAAVTLYADTADGSETQWYVKNCGSSIGYIGSGASITVTPDSNTTYYVRNRNYCVNSNDTLNKLDLLSQACASKRVIRVAAPSALSAPAAQTTCSTGSHTFTFSSVTSGSGGNQIEWAKNSAFTGSSIVSSGSNINVTVSAGVRDTVWFRSRLSSGGCVSSSVFTMLANNANPSVPTAPSAQSVCSDSSHTFTFSNVTAGSGGNQIEWATNSNFTGSTTVSSGSNIQHAVSSNSSTTLYLRSKVSSTGCLSSAVSTTAAANPLVHASVSPTDTAIIFGDSIIITASGGGNYHWLSPNQTASNITVTPTVGNTIYKVVVSNAGGCTDTATATVTTVDSLMLTLWSPTDTIYYGDSTTIIATTNLPNATITWYRDNTARVTGDTIGTGSILSKLLLNDTTTNQPVVFHFEVNYGGHKTRRESDHVYYALLTSPQIEVDLANPTTVSACNELYDFTLTVQADDTWYASSANNNETLIVTLQYPPNFISPVPTSCGNYAITQNASNHEVSWSIPPPSSPIPNFSCTLHLQGYFDCSSDPSNHNTFYTTAWWYNGGNLLHATNVSVSDAGFDVNVVRPEIAITQSLSQNIPNYALIGDQVTRTWSICPYEGRVDNLTISYTPESEIIGNSITLQGDCPTCTNTVTLQSPIQNSYLSSATLNTLFPNPYINTGECIIVTENYIVESCSNSSSTSSTLSASFECGIFADCAPNSATATSNLTIQDDFTTQDNSPITLSSFQIFQDNNPVTTTGMSPCSTSAPVRIEYTFHNPALPATSPLPDDANLKQLGSFTTYINPCWFTASGTGFKVEIRKPDGSNITPPYIYSGGNLTINFTAMNSTINGLDNHANSNGLWPLPNPPHAYNILHEDETFTIIISSITLSPCASQINSCTDNGGYILGMDGGTHLNYSTMCDHSVNLFFEQHDYTNAMQIQLTGGSTGNTIIEGNGANLIFHWGSFDEGDPWAFTDENGNSLLNCNGNTPPKYHAQLIMPAYPSFTLSQTLPITFTPANSSPCNFDAVLVPQFPGSSVVIFNLTPTSALCDLTNAGDLIVPIVLTTDSCVNGQYSNADFTLNLYAECSSCAPNSPVYCMGANKQTLQYHCNGLCNSIVGLLPLNPVLPHEYITVERMTTEPIINGSNVGLELGRAYPCDDIEVNVRGFVWQDPATSVTDIGSIYLQLSYNALSQTSSLLFSVTQAQFSADNGGNWYTITLPTPPLTLHQSIVSNLYGNALTFDPISIDAAQQPAPSSQNLWQNATVTPQQFLFRIRLRVNNNIPYLAPTLGIILPHIDADIRATVTQVATTVPPTSTNDAYSCDTYGEYIMLLQHSYINEAFFIAPDNPAFPMQPSEDICNPRLLIHSFAEGGLSPQFSEMPNELRPLIVWPNPITIDNITGIPNTLQYTNATFNWSGGTNAQVVTNPTPPSNLPVAFLGIGSPAEWPVFGKQGDYYMEMLATFNKATCFTQSESAILDFNYWQRGQNDDCLTPAEYYATPVTVLNQPQTLATYTNLTPTPPLPAPSVTLQTLNANGTYTNPCIITPSPSAPSANPTVQFNSHLTYTGIQPGADRVWVFVDLTNQSTAVPPPPQTPICTLTVSYAGATTPQTIAHPGGYISIPTNITDLAFTATLCACTEGDFNIDFTTGYTCNSSPSLPTPPSGADACGIETSTVTIQIDEPEINPNNCATCDIIASTHYCNSNSIRTSLEAIYSPVYFPEIILPIPYNLNANVITNTTRLVNVVVCLICDGSTTCTTASPNLLGGSISSQTSWPYISYSCASLMHQLLPTDILPVGCRFEVTATYVLSSNNPPLNPPLNLPLYNQSGYTFSIYYFGQNMCGSGIINGTTSYNLPLDVQFEPVLPHFTFDCPDYTTVHVLAYGLDSPHDNLSIYNWSSTTSTLPVQANSTGVYTVAPGGIYNLTVTTPDQCSGTAVLNVPQPLTVSGTANDATCTGSTGSIDITAQHGIPFAITATQPTAYDYSWSGSNNFIATTEDISNLSAGTYTVTVTDANGCSVTASATVSNTPPPTASITPANPTICAGATTTLTASSSTSYLWNTGATSQSINTTGGNYSVTITDANSCTAIASATVNTTSVAAITIATETLTCEAPVKLSVPQGWQNYSWNTSETTNQITGTFDTYSITATDNNGCTATATATVTSPTSAIVIGNSQTSITPLNSLIPAILPASSCSNNIILYGQLQIDVPYTFTMHDAQFAPGAEVAILSGNSLTLTGQSTNSDIFHALNNCQLLWKGITAQAGSTLTASGYILQDAQYAIQLQNKVSFTYSNMVFDRNFVGIYSFTNISVGIYNNLQGNTFNCTGNILASYPGQVNASNMPLVNSMNQNHWSWAGMQIQRGTWRINRDNFFNVSNGIIAYRSLLNVRRTKFYDIPNINHVTAYQTFGMTPIGQPINPVPISNGNAIYADALNFNSTVVVTGFGNNHNNANYIRTFSNCRVGVRAHNGYNMAIAYCGMEDVLNGITAFNNPNRDIRIIRNYITVSQLTQSHNFFPRLDIRAIGLFNCRHNSNSTPGINCINNEIEMINGYVNQNLYGIGIQVSDNTANIKSNLLISNNQITVNTAVDAIQLTSVAGDPTAPNVSLTQNRIWLTNPLYNRNGISVTNSNGIWVTENTISGASVTSPSIGNAATLFPRGFVFNTSPNCMINCNRAFNLTTGYRFESNSSSDNQFISNDIGVEVGTTINTSPITTAIVPTGGFANYIGLHVTNMNTEMGTQANTGNRWFGSYSGTNNNNSAWNQMPTSSSLFTSSMFIVPNPLNPNIQPTPQTPSSSSIFPQNNSFWFSYSNSLGPNCTTTPPALTYGGNNLSALEHAVINGTYEPPFYVGVNTWLAARMVYSKLYINSNLRESEEQVFYDSLSNTNIALLAQTQNAFAQIYTDTFTVSEAAALLLRDTFLMNLEQIDSIDTAEYSPPSIHYLLDSSYNQFVPIQQIIDSLETIRYQSALSKALSAKNINSSISPAEYFETYKQQTNNWYLQLITDTTFIMDSATVAPIQILAEQCYLSNGDAVFDARALLNIIEARNFDDYDQCNYSGSNKRDETESEKTDTTVEFKIIPYYYLFPNPAKSIVTFAIGNGLFTTEEIEITDAVGHKIALLNATTGGKFMPLNTGFISSGVYNCVIRQKGVIVTKLKLVVAQ